VKYKRYLISLVAVAILLTPTPTMADSNIPPLTKSDALKILSCDQYLSNVTIIAVVHQSHPSAATIVATAFAGITKKGVTVSRPAFFDTELGWFAFSPGGIPPDESIDLGRPGPSQVIIHTPTGAKTFSKPTRP
jgi:hypothetical protein